MCGDISSHIVTKNTLKNHEYFSKKKKKKVTLVRKGKTEPALKILQQK